MQAGIVGLPNVGKSTLFNALTSSKAAQAANYPFCTIDKNEGMVSIPDDRLSRISKHIVPKKLVPTAMRLVDIAGIVKGASDNLGLGNKFLSHIREVDAILQVVRCFEDPNVIHVAGEVNPLSDVETVEIELMLADMQSLDDALPRAERTAKSGDKEAVRRVEVLKKCQAHLSTNEPLRKLTLAADEKKSISSMISLAMGRSYRSCAAMPLPLALRWCMSVPSLKRRSLN
jgi:ribosome-binding ATPase